MILNYATSSVKLFINLHKVDLEQTKIADQIKETIPRSIIHCKYYFFYISMHWYHTISNEKSVISETQFQMKHL